MPQTKPTPPLPPISPLVPPTQPQSTSYRQKIEKAKQRVDVMTEEEMRRALNKVISLGYDNVLDILLEP